MKILLIQPPFNSNLIGGGILYMNEPLALEAIGAVVPEHKVKLLDMRVDQNLEHELSNFQPDIVGITAYTTDVYVANDILKKVKNHNKDILTVVGGHHASLLPEDFYKEFVDVIVVGEGQYTFRELVYAYEENRSFESVDGLILNIEGIARPTLRRKLENNLDKFPFPDRNLTKEYRNCYFRASWRPVATVITSRGCPYRCNFCSVWKLQDGKYRTRSPENVLEEILTIEEDYISISDDNFLQDIPRATKIYELIKKSGMKKKFKVVGRTDVVAKNPDIIEKWKEIGLDMVVLGLESIRDEELKWLNKKTTVKTNEEAINVLNKNNIKVIGQFIIHPEYTYDDFEALFEYIQKTNISHPLFTILTPLPRTELYYQKEGQLLTRNYEMFDLAHCVLPTKLPREEFHKCFADLLVKCYSNQANPDSALIPKPLLQKLYSQILNGYKLLS